MPYSPRPLAQSTVVLVCTVAHSFIKVDSRQEYLIYLWTAK